MSTVPTIRFPTPTPARPHKSGLAAAQKFQTNRDHLRIAQDAIRTMAQEMAEVDGQDADFDPTPNAVTVVGKVSQALYPAAGPNYVQYRHGNPTVDAETRYNSDGVLTYFNGVMKCPAYPQWEVTVKYERKEVGKGIPFVNRHRETVQDYKLTDPIGTSFKLRLNEATGILTD